MRKASKQSADIQRLNYSPSPPYQLDFEVFSVSDLRRRVDRERISAAYRYEFHELVYVTRGKCTQMTDFEATPCESGSLLVLRPGQVHSFGRDEDWDGWIMLFRPEFVLPASTSRDDLKFAVDMERLPRHLRLRGHELRHVADSIAQMHEDSLIDAPFDDVHALLRHQLYALLTRLCILHGRQQDREKSNSALLKRFERFEQRLERRYGRWHQVADYARDLGCTEKTLTRTAMATVGVSAKALIAARLNLEAKRLLVHTNLPIASVAEKLGFQEATNFSKFFRREAGCTPAEFRRRFIESPAKQPGQPFR